MTTDGSGVTALAAESTWTKMRAGTRLAPVQHRWRWITGGLLVEAAGVGATLAWLYERIKHDGLTGQALRATVMLVWHEMLTSRSGVAVLAASAVLVAVGSVLAARPFVRSVVTLTVAVPLAAITGLLVLGAVVLVVALFFALAGFFDNVNVGGGSSGSGSGTKKKDRKH